MERNTVLAVVLSTIVLIAAFAIQGMFYPPVTPAPVDQSQIIIDNSNQEISPVQMTEGEQGVQREYAQQPEVQQTAQQAAAGQLAAQTTSALDAGPSEINNSIRVETDLFIARFTNVGGNMTSFVLKNHKDKDVDMEMIFAGTNEPQAFSIAFGGIDAQPITDLFYYERLSDYSIAFHRDFAAPGTVDGYFRLTKQYDFIPNEYMFELSITLAGGHSVPGINFAGNAYTLSFGPQIGPEFAELKNYYDEYRQYVTFTKDKRKDVKVNDVITNQPSWVAINGRYFVFFAIPYYRDQYSIIFTDKSEPGLPMASRFNLVRPATNASFTKDTYRFFLGPKSNEVLTAYTSGMGYVRRGNNYKNEGTNFYFTREGMKDTHLEKISSSWPVLAPLVRLLKWLLQGINSIVNNYGVSIILVTLLVKIVFFPLTKKGSEATIRMQALAPKMKELQEKYKDNRQKLNAEMAQFYQKEGYNPISGCLPMLLQLPIFFAMYQLFLNHFDLRGAMFIPGWIPDLSVPEYIVQFPEGFKLPILGWTALRALPFIYVGSQLMYGKVTQMPGQQSNTQMKMMLYVMPIMFFFILYNVPSGLLIYWIFSNLLTLVQQLIINKFIVAKKAAMAQAAPPPPVIAPGKKKKRRI